MKHDVIIEISKNSNIKYEYDVKDKSIRVDRILYGSNVYPANYGFMDNTLDYDGDPLDVLIISDHSFLPGTIVPVRILGGIYMIDDGEVDNKLISVIDCDPRFNNINSLKDIEVHRIAELINFFETYKILQKKVVKIDGTFEAAEAKKIISETELLYKQYQKEINLGKIKEIKESLRKNYPDKFSK